MNTEEQINNLWRENIYQAIADLSDLESQNTIWLGKSLVFESSFDEYIMTLYDDFHFENFISELNCKEMNLSADLSLEMNRLNVLINAYDITKPDIEVLLDPNWHAITIQAQSVIKVWDKCI